MHEFCTQPTRFNRRATKLEWALVSFLSVWLAAAAGLVSLT
ncbi:hypothetical protein OCOJLMKI_5159 [Methylobacterium iners]|uniref:Uncharacterized protein n=1 Tax=Methylobacterium iners TaxID=418707 RepID=A0ABQ4S8C0_9HYPH|nr:hypothetical protein OCOJLMKI_5159 [Methylobacterium iners]